MYLGSIVERTNNIDLFNKPKHPYTKALLSSVLNTSLDTKKERIRLIGDVPNPLNKPSGCSFHTRCIYAKINANLLNLISWKKIMGIGLHVM